MTTLLHHTQTLELSMFIPQSTLHVYSEIWHINEKFQPSKFFWLQYYWCTVKSGMNWENSNACTLLDFYWNDATYMECVGWTEECGGRRRSFSGGQLSCCQIQILNVCCHWLVSQVWQCTLLFFTQNAKTMRYEVIPWILKWLDDYQAFLMTHKTM